MLKELGNAQKLRIGGLAQLTVRVKPAQKARKGRNPATNKESTIAAKPASPRASADEGDGRAAERAESPPTTGRANGLTHPWALINGVSFRQPPTNTNERRASAGVQLITRLTTQRCLPICRWRVNPWRSNIATVPLWRKEPDTVRSLVSSG
jgi:hypothetical protein